MYEFIISVRNKIIRLVYKFLFKPVFFLMEPERIHILMVGFGSILGKYRLCRWKTRLLFGYSNKSLEQNILGINFLNPTGLAAGFDKDAEITDIVSSVGFGFEEIGSVTGEPCEGNPGVRLWRLPKNKALVVYYGLKSKGCEYISQKLKGKKFNLPIGASVAKTNSPDTVDTDKGVADYVKAFKILAGIGDYFTINISCPNAYGGEPFTDAVKLEKLLAEIDKIPTKKPVFLKISPDLDRAQIDAILEVAAKHRIHGFVCTNLTKNRNNLQIKEECPPNGGISGLAVRGLSDEMIKYVYRKTKGNYVIIGTGGIISAEDAYRKIRLGASLLQMITAMIFEGPEVVSEINQGLAKMLKRDGFKNISEAVGIDNKI